VRTRPGCSVNVLSQSANTKNQLVGDCYDLAGNLLGLSAPPCPSPTYSYNAENQMTLTAGVTYTYDGDGKRVKKSSGTLYWHGAGSDPLDETDLAGSTANAAFKEYIFFDGKRIARRDYQNNVNYYFADHLGTARVVTNAGGAILDDSDFYPFGGERVILSSSGNSYKFTGKERDSESGLDNFGARYYANTKGRFMSPDEVFADQHTANPQSWNLYSYARNNPLGLVDPTGNYAVCSAEFSSCGSEGVGISPEEANAYFQQVQEQEKANQKNSARKPKGRKAKSRPLVKAQPGKLRHSKAASDRDVSYYAVTLDSNGKPLLSPNHALTLSERWKGEPGAAHICDPSCVEKDPEHIRHSEMIDSQSVLSGQNYSIERRWSVDGIAAGVLDEKNFAWDFEIMRVTNDVAPYFTIEYGNDPKSPN